MLDEKENNQEFQEEDFFQFLWHSIYDAYIEPLVFTNKLHLFCTCVP